MESGVPITRILHWTRLSLAQINKSVISLARSLANELTRLNFQEYKREEAEYEAQKVLVGQTIWAINEYEYPSNYEMNANGIYQLTAEQWAEFKNEFEECKVTSSDLSCYHPLDIIVDGKTMDGYYTVSE